MIARLFELALWALVAFGLFFSLLASQGCSSESAPWRVRDYCETVADEFCGQCDYRLDSPCWTRIYRGCADAYEGYVPAHEAAECLGAIDAQECTTYTLPDACPYWP